MSFSLACNFPMGMEDGTIQDAQISASSTASPPSANHTSDYYSPHQGRLNSAGHIWCAGTDDKNQWLKVDLGLIKKVTGVASQGEGSKFTKSYFVEYSLDNTEWFHFTTSSGSQVHQTSLSSYTHFLVHSQFVNTTLCFHC